MSEVTVSQEFIDKAIVALNKSSFWEFADCPVTIRIAMRQAELDGRRMNNAARSSAKLILKRVRDPVVRNYVAVIARSNDVNKHLGDLEAYRDRLISKIAEEFVEVSKASSVRDYRINRTKRVAITGVAVGKRTLAEMYPS